MCIIGLTSWYLITMQSAQTGSSIELTKNVISEPVESSSDSSHELLIAGSANNNANDLSEPTTVISNLTLLAVVVANPSENSSAVIQFNSTSGNYSIGEMINATGVLLEEVFVDSVTVSLEGKEYQLSLKGGDADAYVQPNNSYINENETPMTAKEIGNRPKQLDHIIVISPENNNYTVVPGINPALFKAAKFKAGDILKTINGKDVTDPEELEQANALITTAQTLEFVVLRGGQFVTLYLDIPSKNLSISN